MSVLSTLLSEDGGYQVNVFPPISCGARNSNFYAVILPLNAVAVIGICQLIIIGWIIHKVVLQYVKCLHVCACLSVCLSVCLYCLAIYVCVYVCVCVCARMILAIQGTQ